MQSRQPYHVMGAIVVALALSFAAGAGSASSDSTDMAERVKTEALVADYLDAAPLEHFVNSSAR